MPLPRDAERLWPWFAWLTAATYGLLVLGALVRAHGAGLACPDWPLCEGRLVPSFDLRIGFEWSHRVLAAAVALGFAAEAAATLRRPPLRDELRAPLGLAAALLVVQILLGALTVWLRLTSWTVTVHLLVGTAFCAKVLWITVALREREAPPERPPLGSRQRAAAFAVAGMVVGQLTLGGMVSSHAAGLACADFPSCDGSSLAPTFEGLVGIHVLHRLGGYTLLAAFLVLAALTRGTARVGALWRAGLHLVLLQVLVGAANVLLRLPVEVTALHSALAAAIALVTTLLLREAWLSPAGAALDRRAALEAT